MTNSASQIIGVASVAFDGNGRILLIRTAKAGWELPGGRVEDHEDFIDAVKREVVEETGCVVEIARLTGITSQLGSPSVTILTFLCRHVSGDPRPADDSIEADWFIPDEAVALVCHPIERIRLADALRDEEHVIYRSYSKLPGEQYKLLCHHIC